MNAPSGFDKNEEVRGTKEEGPTAARVWLEKLASSATLHSWPPEFVLDSAKTHLIGAGLLAKNHEDADQLLHDIEEFTRVNENVMRTTRKETTKKKIEGGKGVPSKAETTGYKCGEKGHYKSECKNKEVEVCFLCKCKDHLAKHCPNKQKIEQKTGTVMTVNKIQRQEVVRQDSESEMLEGDMKNVKVKEVASKIENLYRPVMVNGVSLNGMVDNGSSMCIIKESVVRHKKWSIRLDEVKLYGYGCGGNPVKCIGVLEASVEIDLVKLEKVMLCVVSDHMQTVDVIIGRTFTKDLTIAYYRVNNELKFSWRENFPFKNIEVERNNLKNSQISNQKVLVPVANDTKADIFVGEGELVGSVKEHLIMKVNEIDLSVPREISVEDIHTEKVPYPIPTIKKHFENLSGSKIFTTLDLAHGYLQIPLTKGAKEKTAFITPDETGQFERMIFGLTNDPYEFCRLMNTALGLLKNKICAFETAKLTLKLKKCMFGLPQVEYLGCVVSEKGIAPGKAKVEAIKKFPGPKKVHEVRRFLGITAYFRRFTPNYAVRARPLSDLTKKTVMFQWNEE
ncbi:hypothetical protein ILUMI_20305 [Ignelater luminosus]|uniref:CCHC-type domain-containing protein n=1 Tax=Ignelater luminosus TaxID=2038154 RepID=A0A8K0G501_IGNLU|nr:hypothetical protein ILUMI_20305 [Ignelater luminosus]